MSTHWHNCIFSNVQTNVANISRVIFFLLRLVFVAQFRFLRWCFTVFRWWCEGILGCWSMNRCVAGWLRFWIYNSWLWCWHLEQDKSQSMRSRRLLEVKIIKIKFFFRIRVMWISYSSEQSSSIVANIIMYIIFERKTGVSYKNNKMWRILMISPGIEPTISSVSKSLHSDLCYFW